MAHPHTPASSRDRRAQPTGFTARQKFLVALLRKHLRVRHGTLFAPTGLVVDGVNISAACRYLKEKHRQGRLAPEIVADLERIPGWSWTPLRDHEVRCLELLRGFVAEHGWDSLTQSTIIDGESVGTWVTSVRWRYRMGQVRPRLRAELEAINGWTWRGSHAASAKNYRERKLRMHIRTVTSFLTSGTHKRLTKNTVFRGISLRGSIHYLKTRYGRGELPRWAVEMLESLDGWVWSRHDETRSKNIERLRKLAAQLGGLPNVTGETVIDGYLIGPWLGACWRKHREGTLPPEMVRQLESIPGWIWKRSRDDDYHRGIAALRKFLENHDLCDIYTKVFSSGMNIKNWVQSRRRAYVLGKKMPDWLVRELEALPGWSWTPKKDRGEVAMQRWKSPRK